jgi:hypothetical protein
MVATAVNTSTSEELKRFPLESRSSSITITFTGIEPVQVANCVGLGFGRAPPKLVVNVMSLVFGVVEKENWGDADAQVSVFPVSPKHTKKP